MRPRYARLLEALVLVAYVAWAILYVARTSFLHEGVRVFTLWDDAMVSMRYAEHFVAGRGLSWNDGECVQGYSNTGITLFMALLHLLPMAKEKLSLVFMVASVGVLAVSAVLVRQVTAAFFGDPWAGRAAALLFMVCAPLAVLTLQGTDVGVECLLLLLALNEVAKRAPESPLVPRRAYVYLLVAVVVRLDMTLVFVVFLAAALASPRDRAGLRFPLALLAATLAVLLGGSLLYYGDALPNTYYLKATGSPRALVLASGAEQALYLLTTGWFAIAFAVVGAVAWFRRDPRVRLLGALTLAILLYNVWVGGDWVGYHFGRFVAPAVMLLLMMFAGVLARGMGALAALLRNRRGDRLARRLAPAGVIVVALAASPAFNDPEGAREWFDPAKETLLRAYNIRNYRIADYLRRHLDHDAKLGIGWAGMIPYFSELPSIDFLGKSDRHIARMKVSIFAPGHSKWDFDYLLQERKPDVIFTTSEEMVARADFKHLYRRVEAGAPWSCTVYVLADAMTKLHDPAATVSEVR